MFDFLTKLPDMLARLELVLTVIAACGVISTLLLAFHVIRSESQR